MRSISTKIGYGLCTLEIWMLDHQCLHIFKGNFHDSLLGGFSISDLTETVWTLYMWYWCQKSHKFGWFDRHISSEYRDKPFNSWFDWFFEEDRKSFRTTSAIKEKIMSTEYSGVVICQLCASTILRISLCLKLNNPQPVSGGTEEKKKRRFTTKKSQRNLRTRFLKS